MNDVIATSGISEKSLEIICGALRAFSAVEEVIVFGSRAKGNPKNGSDIDLALRGSGVTPTLALEISAILNERLPLPYFFDVLSYDHIENPDLKDHIDRVGKPLYRIQPACNRAP
jgi:uncharacterized protein